MKTIKIATVFRTQVKGEDKQIVNLVSVNGDTEGTTFQKSNNRKCVGVAKNNLTYTHMVLINKIMGELVPQLSENTVVELYVTQPLAPIARANENSGADKLEFWLTDSKKSEEWKAETKALLESIKAIEAKDCKIVWSAAPYAKAVQEAWDVMNKIVPQAEKKNKKEKKEKAAGDLEFSAVK